jgi:hypothetical protein
VHVVVRQAEVVADFVHQHVGDDRFERVSSGGRVERPNVDPPTCKETYQMSTVQQGVIWHGAADALP